MATYFGDKSAFLPTGVTRNLTVQADGRRTEISNPKVDYDRRALESFEESLRIGVGTMGIGSEILKPFKIELLNRTVYLLINNQSYKIGRTSYLPRLLFDFLPNKSLQEIFDLITSCMSPETSSSSPSMVLHQIVSLTIASSSVDRTIFEDTSRSNQPDLVLSREGKAYLFDITSDIGVIKKINDYVATGQYVIAIDKYSFFRYTYSDTPFGSWLYDLSWANDKKDVGFIQKIMSRQNLIGAKQLWNSQFAEFLMSTNRNILIRISSYFTKAIIRSMESHQVSTSVAPSYNRHSKFIDSSSFKWLQFAVRPTSLKTELIAVSPELTIQDSELRFNTEHVEEKEFFDINPIIMMDYRSMEEMLRYRRYNIEQETAAYSDLKYYEREVDKFSSTRNPNYFKLQSTGKVRLKDPKDPGRGYNLKEPKAYVGITRVIRTKAKDFPDIEVFSDIDNILETDHGFIDPIDYEILKDHPQVSSMISYSKIYQLLNLFRKAAQAILFSQSVIDGRRMVVRHPSLDISCHIYCSGDPVQVDKGIAYVSLISADELVKTWAWRSSDIRSFSLASSRLISTSVGASLCVDESKLRTMFNLYSLLLLENSWGNSKFLKPYRYWTTGLAYSSPLVSLQYDKFIKALYADIKVASSKMSIAYMCYHLKDIEPGRTPILHLSEANIGFEAFLVNLCPSETYGKRSHRVSMLKEVVSEIELSESSFDKVVQHYNNFFYLKDKLLSDESEQIKEKLVNSYVRELDSIALTSGGRFTSSPIGIIAMFPVIDKFCTRSASLFQGSVPKLSTLLTMKGSFDTYNFKNASALESISIAASEEGHSTTMGLAYSILSRPADLTFRMFDKDQVGGDREISILSSQYRVLQSITENFSRVLGKATGIDMLDNTQKVQLLVDAHNFTKDGLRLTADQTRWGPNFPTTLFSYMMSMILRYTTEAFVPMIVCAISEFKVFQMLHYPELARYQKQGYTLPGKAAPFHMGQGIFHYTSSLWHSLVHLFWQNILNPACGLRPDEGSIVCRSFVTSDDVAQFLYYHPSEKVSDSRYKEVKGNMFKSLRNYNHFLRFFCILTSDYKNMISDNSVEFNSIFLNKDSVGSNSLKFLYSLLDPYTSGNKLRDLRRVFDTYTDCLNSGLNLAESKILFLLTVKQRLLQWGEKSNEIIEVVRIANEQFASLRRNGIQESTFPILATSKTICDRPDKDFECPTVLPFKRYGDMVRSLDELRKVMSLQHEMDEIELKSETIKKAKQRRLGSNRGLVLSKKLRKMSAIVLPFQNKLGATTVSSTAYLAAVSLDGTESGLINPESCVVNEPSLSRKEFKAGFGVEVLRKSNSINISTHELLYSSYPRVDSINHMSSILEIQIHIARRYQRLKTFLSERVSSLRFNERLRYFDQIVADSRVTGNAISLKYSPENYEYSSFLFEDITESIQYMPSLNLPLPLVDIGRSRTFSSIIYHWDLIGSNSKIDKSMDPLEHLPPPSLKNFEINLEDLIISAKSLIRSDLDYTSQSRDAESMFLNIQIKIVLGKQKIKSLEVPGFKATTIEDLSKFKDLLLDTLLEFGLELESDDPEPDDDDLFETRERLKVERRYISLPIKRHASIITEFWFRKAVYLNGILYSMIRQGFVQNTTKNSDQAILFSGMIGERRVGEPAVKMKGPYSKTLDCRLAANFHIKSMCNELLRKISINKGASELKRISQIISVSENVENYNLDVLGVLPSSTSVTSEPLGELISVFQWENLVKGTENERSGIGSLIF